MDKPINPLTGSIEEKIDWAEDVFCGFGRQLLDDPRVSRLIADLKVAISASRGEMVRAGVVSLCKTCDQKEGGACCGSGLEDKYDGWLLLTNRMMGINLIKIKRTPTSCMFLGPEGCRLAARQVICINYLCQKITSQIEPSKIRTLKEKEGIEIACLFTLIETVKDFIRGKIK